MDLSPRPKNKKLMGLEGGARRRSTNPLLKTALAILFSLSVVHVFLAPVSAWDAIDWWVASADRFIAVDTQLLPQFIWEIQLLNMGSLSLLRLGFTGTGVIR